MIFIVHDTHLQLVSVEGLSAYWLPEESNVLSELPADAVQSALHAGIRRRGEVAPGTVIKSAALRLLGTHNDDPADAIGPKYAAKLEISEFDTDVQAEQVLNILPYTFMYSSDIHVSQLPSNERLHDLHMSTLGIQPCVVVFVFISHDSIA